MSSLSLLSASALFFLFGADTLHATAGFLPTLGQVFLNRLHPLALHSCGRYFRAMEITQKELYSKLRAEAIAAREKIASVTRGLDAAKLNEHPEPNGWSVGQVLEHLLVSDESYAGPLAALLSKSPRD